MNRIKSALHHPAAGGVILLFASAVALGLANSSTGDAYRAFWATRVGVAPLERDLAFIVNDILMAIFFFVVGLEIKRELAVGSLSRLRQAALPLAAAIGGMLGPAGLYLMFARTPETRAAWAVPMATDIAFALGILALLGTRVPASLRILLLALAVIDDLGAISVIAFFYSSGVKVTGLGIGALGVALVFGLRRAGIAHKLAYVIPGIVVWGGIYNAGVHPTIAGVILGLLTPLSFANGAPVDDLIAKLHGYVTFAIMPIFALANAGVELSGAAMSDLAMQIVTGTCVGLLVGKPVGILIACALALRLKLAELPKDLETRHLIVLGCVAAIGFTMSLFIAQLALPDPALLAAGKLAILGASATACVFSLVLGLMLLRSPSPPAGTSFSPTHSVLQVD